MNDITHSSISYIPQVQMAVNGRSQSQRPFSPPVYPPPPPTLSPGLGKIQQGRCSGECSFG